MKSLKYFEQEESKRILVRQGFFVTKPLQNFTDELSDIMGAQIKNHACYQIIN
jgi:hypothetical protein